LRAPGATTHCSDLLAMPWTMLFDAARRHPAQPLDLPLWSGLRLQALAQWSAHTHRSSATSTVSPFSPTGAAPLVSAPPPVAAPLREAETALIRQAVLDARGNVAEAARALGISRATVYRKLGTPKGS